MLKFPASAHPRDSIKEAFEYLRIEATKEDANPLLGIAFDEWSALAIDVGLKLRGRRQKHETQTLG